MEITITKKAQKLISQFNDREKKTFDYITELLKSDNKNFKDIEIARRAGDDKNAVKTGTLLVYRMNERALYIMQCLGIHASMQTDSLSIDLI